MGYGAKIRSRNWFLIGQPAQLEIGFTGSILLIDAGIQGDIQVSLDGERTQPVICYGMMNIKAAPGSHSLHITVHSPSRLALRAMGVEGTEQLLELPSARISILPGFHYA